MVFKPLNWTLPPTRNLALAVHVAPQCSGLLGSPFQVGLSSSPGPAPAMVTCPQVTRLCSQSRVSPFRSPPLCDRMRKLLLEEQPWGMQLHHVGAGRGEESLHLRIPTLTACTY